VSLPFGLQERSRIKPAAVGATMNDNLRKVCSIPVLCMMILMCSCSKRNSTNAVVTQQSSRSVEVAKAPVTRPSAPTTRARKLTDLKLGPELTRDQVIAVWGPPDGDRGFGVEYKAYAMPDGQELWLVFSPTSPRYLITALLVRADGQDKLLFARERSR